MKKIAVLAILSICVLAGCQVQQAEMESTEADITLTEEVSETGFCNSEFGFSIYLEQEEGSTGFYTRFYNNAIGEEEFVEWVWDKEGKYISEDSQNSDAGLKSGNIEFTLVPENQSFDEEYSLSAGFGENAIVINSILGRNGRADDIFIYCFIL